MDKTFALLATQFLSLLNDFTLKQIVLLMLVGGGGEIGGSEIGVGRDWQGIAIAVFAAPFLIFAGHAGRVSDRLPRYRVIVRSKVAEVLVMTAALAALLLPQHYQMAGMLIALFAMATQSTYLTPAKYSIILDLVGQDRMARVNGMMQLTSYSAMIVGAVLGGFLMTFFSDQPVAMGGCLIVIAIAGWITSRMIPKSGVAEHTMLQTAANPWKRIFADRLMGDTFITFTFVWLIAGLYQPLINLVGKQQLGWSDLKTSLLLSMIAVGIACGCGVAGWITTDAISRRIMWCAAWGLVATQLVCGLSTSIETNVSTAAFFAAMWTTGFLTGLIVLPLHVMIQTRSSAAERGRNVAAQHWLIYAAVLVSGVIYQALGWFSSMLDLTPNGMFLLIAIGSSCGVVMLWPSEDRWLVIALIRSHRMSGRLTL